MEPEGIGPYIKRRRAELGLSQRKLAKAAGMTASYLAQIEKSMDRWPTKYVAGIAEALGVPEVELARAAGKIGTTDTVLEVLTRAGEIGSEMLASMGGAESGEVRKHRDRFRDADDAEKLRMYWTNYEALIGLVAMVTSAMEANSLEVLTDLSVVADSPT